MTSVTNTAFERSRPVSAFAAQAVRRFSRPRFALIVLLGVYPLITSLLYLLAPLAEGWPLWQRTLVIASLMVCVMIWGLIPAVQRLFRGFLNRAIR